MILAARKMYRVLAFVLVVRQGAHGFFDLSDVEDPLSIFWSHKNALLQERITTCSTTLNDGTTVHGLCENKAQCILTKGLPLAAGTCPSSFSTCCNYVRSCDKSTKLREAYFTSGADVSSYRECNYNVQIINDNVCQIRIDFEKFVLAPPTAQTQSTGSQSYKCEADSFTVSPNPNNVPQLCGLNSGQHVYVAVEEGTKTVSLKFALRERTASQALVTPEWRLRVRQLECPKLTTLLDKFKSYQAAKDFPLIAPHYAVQYFTERTGYVRSFGFDDSSTTNKYTNGQKYAIAFRRSRGVCGIRLTGEQFNLPSNLPCEDYLYVPKPNVQGSNEVCGTSLDITASPPGPIIVTFVSNDVYSGTAANNEGFKIRYELLSSC